MKIDWKTILLTFVISIIAVVFIYPLVRPLLVKIPVVGKYA